MTEVIDKITKCDSCFCIVPVLRRGFDLPLSGVCFMFWVRFPKCGSNCALARVGVFFHDVLFSGSWLEINAGNLVWRLGVVYVPNAFCHLRVDCTQIIMHLLCRRFVVKWSTSTASTFANGVYGVKNSLGILSCYYAKYHFHVLVWFGLLGECLKLSKRKFVMPSRRRLLWRFLSRAD